MGDINPGTAPCDQRMKRHHQLIEGEAGSTHELYRLGMIHLDRFTEELLSRRFLEPGNKAGFG
jgi:hypothetical protein